jgi:hypothetical protein
MADLPDWSEKLFFGAGSARSHARNASDFMTSHRPESVLRLRAVLCRSAMRAYGQNCSFTKI